MESKPGIIDLHIHSCFSDGSLSPEQILERAAEEGLSAISITDHDTIAGAREALRHGIPRELDFVTGVEISAAFPSTFGNAGSLHILGYGIATDHKGLNKALDKQCFARSNRNPLIIEKLNAIGIPASIEAVSTVTGKKDIARPHIADYMVKSGYAKDIDDAFDRFLGKGKPAYVDKFRIPAEKAISLILEAGGIAVLAHPVLLLENKSDTFPDTFLENLVDTLASCGLGGIEAYYPGQTAALTTYFEDIAARKGLLTTGGTDFHGEITPGVKMGSGYDGNLSIPHDIFRKLWKALNRNNGRE